MLHPEDDQRLAHMLAYAREAAGLLREKSRRDLAADRVLQLALARAVEIVGEAATRISEARRQRIPTIPWADVTGMRNRLVHVYDDVDFDILWDTVQVDLPPLIDPLEAALTATDP